MHGIFLRLHYRRYIGTSRFNIILIKLMADDQKGRRRITTNFMSCVTYFEIN